MKVITNKINPYVDLSEELFQVVIKPAQMPHNLRLTYSKKKGGRMVQMEEINANEEVLGFCTFKGNSGSGSKCDWMIDIKRAYADIKATDWLISGIFVDQFYKKH